VSAIFYVVAFVSFVQLLICCFAEYKRLKNPSFLKACRITTQKFLYFVVFLASLLRAAYFTQPESAQPSWAYYLMSACASLVVCCWAEVSEFDYLFSNNLSTNVTKSKN
jgi:von Hippel-Lindau disease tumor supressor